MAETMQSLEELAALRPAPAPGWTQTRATASLRLPVA